ncbi:hypothetical protein H4S00_000899 [Coemansia sp. D1744]|nr:hypothetical protein H4S00_000899 [Coemansia sp. D1744]
MRLGNSLLTLAAGLSTVFASSPGELSAPTLFRRNGTEDLQAFKGAVLLKNGEQTSCEVALMYSTFGFVSAACLDFTDDTAKTVNMSTSYEVMISGGLTSSYGRFRASRVTPNPNYDPASYANNIAILQFDSNGDDFVNYIASWRADWANMYFNDLICNQLTTTSIMNATCSIPYASMYGVIDPNAAIAAIYSHSAVYGQGNFCNGNKIYNYYIVMQNYVHWAMSVIGKKAPVFHTRIAEYTENMDANYSMTIPGNKNVESVLVYGGDLYHLNTTMTGDEESEEKGGLSTGAIIGILLGLLALLALLGYFIHKKIKERLASNRVRRWWFFGRFEKEEKPEHFDPQMTDPNDPHRPSAYPVQF